MFPLPFTATEYGTYIVEQVISTELLIWSHIPTAIIGIVFAFVLYRLTKKLSALYLLFLTVTFAIWSYLELITWGAPQEDIMFTWSVLDIFGILFTIFTYWFLYVFVKGTDVSFWQKLVSLTAIIPVYVYTYLGTNLNVYYNPEIIAIESNLTVNILLVEQFIFLFVIILFTLNESRKAQNASERNRIFLGGLGASLFLFIFAFSYLITNISLLFGINTVLNESYVAGVYALFGMPFLVGFMSYLIAKYQAFDLKLTNSICFILLLMLILLLSIFI